MKRDQIVVAAIGVTVVFASVAACSSNKSTTGSTTSPVHLRVTSLGLCNETAELAVDSGIFAKHRLDVSLIRVKSGSAGIAALQGGSTDFAFVSPQAMLTAIQQGVNMQIITDSGETTKDSQGIIVRKGSGITGPAGLKGKTVAVNDLGGTAVTLIRQWVAKAGVDPSTLKFVALNFGDIEPAVETGKVDVGATSADGIQKFKMGGYGDSIGNPTFDGVGATPNALYSVTTSWLKQHEDVAKRFTAAMQDAADYALNPANATAKFATWSKYCKRPAAILANTPELAYTGYVNMTAMANVVNQFKQAKILKSDFDVTKYVPVWARESSSTKPSAPVSS